MIMERNALGEEILKQVNEEQSRMSEQLQNWFSANEISAAERFDKLDEVYKCHPITLIAALFAL